MITCDSVPRIALEHKELPMENEKTSKRVGKIAAAYMHHPDPNVRALAASALTQRPDHKPATTSGPGFAQPAGLFGPVVSGGAGINRPFSMMSVAPHALPKAMPSAVITGIPNALNWDALPRRK